MSIDVLIITALPLEFDHLLEVQAGLVDVWRDAGDHDLPHHRARLDGVRGPLEVAALRLTKAGGVETATEVMRYLPILDPKYLAMSGVCGGNPDDTVFGDVVIADRVVQHDEGKLKVSGFEGDLWTHQATKPWRHIAGGMDGKPALGRYGYAIPDEDVSQWWILEQLEAGRVPRNSIDYERYFPDSLRAAYMRRIEEERQYVRRDAGAFVLTDAGRSALANWRLDRPSRITSLPYHIRVGVMGSGNAVQADGAFWAKMKTGGVRKAMAVDMEAFAVGHVATEKALPFIVIKGVMDYAHPDKNDNYKPFAARASAEVLCDFLRKVCVPRGSGQTAVVGLDVRVAEIDRGKVEAAISTELASFPTSAASLGESLGTDLRGADLARLLLEHDDVLALVDKFYEALKPLEPRSNSDRRLAASLRAIFDVLIPTVAGPRTTLRVGTQGRLETNARNTTGLDARMALDRQDKKLDFHRATGPRSTPRLGFDLGHPEAGMVDREHALVIGKGLEARMNATIARRMAAINQRIARRVGVEPGVLSLSLEEQLRNVKNALRAWPQLYCFAREGEADLAEVVRTELTGLSVVFSMQDESWEYQVDLGWKICDFYDQYFRVNPEDASR